MNLEESESLLRQAIPPVPPPEWRDQIIDSALRSKGSRPVLPQLAWSALAACWAVILLLHVTTPAVPQGTFPFDPVAYALRADVMEQLASLDEWKYEQEPELSHIRQIPPPAQEPIKIELRMKLPAPHTSLSPPNA